MIDDMNRSGYTYVGYDSSVEAHQLYLKHYGAFPDRYVQSLDLVEQQRFDLLLSFDVFEHMRDSDIAEILTHTEIIPDLFINISRNRTTPGHINIKKDRQWIHFFSQHRIEYDEATTRAMRAAYREMRPGCPDLWNRNMFVLRRV